MYQAIFFDLSGVLYTGNAAIPGAVEAVAQAQRSRLAIRFVTNTSRRTSNQIIGDLKNLGFDIPPEQLYTAPIAAKQWVKEHQLRPYCLIHQSIVPEFSDLDQQNPNAVIIGDAEENFCYKKLNYAFQLCKAGAPLIGIGCNRYFKLDDQLHLDAGPFIKAIEYASSSTPIIMGKPSADFFKQIVATTGVSENSVLMIGDDIFGDVQGAIKAGLSGCLVKTGKYLKGDELLIQEKFHIAGTVAEAVNLALNQVREEPD
ncbi:TIGR01458 family HAD-type hydrolase [Motiliproteus sp. MSK22-1]|uniref:TIGR01458 family HAD-type hydrolase n=1 Tax=Motiliproteus sp. MSK22-1 TaxID=1897630 RepID=UPI0009783087|nr:TIGR01458 family HAD-type hydrolase [Motiliproteus sp. MSK22-1]OMH25292.1 hydrolase [Motiliproteus sp. MSK22-1]